MKNQVGSDVIDVLTQKCRLLSADQVAALSFGHTLQPEVIARQWLRRKAKDGIVELCYMHTHPEIDVSKPLLDWHPGDPTPDFPALAWRTQSRWTSPPKRNMLAAATPKAKQLTGGALGGRPIRIREATHDYHVSALYLHFLEHFPELAKRWIPEDAIDSGSHHDKRPDAIITGAEPVIIEFGGAYPAARLRQHWEFARAEGHRFQLY